jgi:hypothetical protein
MASEYPKELWNKQSYALLVVIIILLALNLYSFLRVDNTRKSPERNTVVPHISTVMMGDNEVSLPQFINTQSEKFTVYLNTFDRDVLLKKCVEHYGRLPHIVDKIIISWNNIDRDPPETSYFKSQVPIVIIKETRDSLNNRFQPHLNLINTDGILCVDDDIMVFYEDLDFVFQTWRMFPEQPIGFTVYTRTQSRNNTMGPCSDTIDGLWHYAGECGSGDGKRFVNYDPIDYTLALDSAMFFHRKYLYMYTYEMSQQVRDHVDQVRNCEDIALPYLIAIHSKFPTIMIDNQRDLKHMQFENEKGKHVGINTESGHYEKRHNCLNLFAKLMYDGKMPLFRTTFKVSRLTPSDLQLHQLEKKPEIADFQEEEYTVDVNE